MHTLYIITEFVCAIGSAILFFYAIPKTYITAMREALQHDQPKQETRKPYNSRSYNSERYNSHQYKNGKATYFTLKKTSQGWMYCGKCHAGENIEP